MQVYNDEPSLVYNSQINLNRMTGNWWFPYDIFVVPQGNGDLYLYAPGIVGAVYQWDAVSSTFTSPPGLFDVMVANANGTWTRTTKDGTVWVFNTGGYLLTITNRYGLATTINRNGSNAITSIVDYAGRSTTLTYTGSYVTSMTDWGGRTTAFTYTAQGYLATVTMPSTTFYDRQTSTTVTRGKVLTFTYTSGTGTNLDGNLLTAVDDRGQNVLTNAYDSSDRSTSITMRGRTWNHTYLTGGSTQVVDPDGVTIVYSFNANGAITRKEVFTQTGLGQTTLRTGEPNSYVWLYERNAGCGCDLVTKVTYPDGTTRAHTYDSWGNMLSETLDPPSGTSGTQIKRTWTFSTFSQFCRLLTYTTPEGYASGATAADHTQTWTYDSAGSVTQVQWPKATINGTLQHAVVTFTRNSVGKATKRTWPDGREDTFQWAANTYYATSITKDSLGLALTTTYSLDTYGRIVSETNPRGYTTTNTWNALDQRIEFEPPQPLGATITWLYDNNGNVYQTETQNKDETGTVSSTNPWFTTTTAYDTNNFLTGVTSEIDASTTATTTFEWTAGGRLKKVTDPNGDVVETVYDERGLPFKIKEAPGAAIEGVTTINYDLNGLTAEVVDPRGNATAFAYDHGFRVVEVTFADSSSAAMAYDLNGQILQSEQKDSSGVVKLRSSWEFDPSGHLLNSQRHHVNGSGTTTSTDTTTYLYDSGLRLKTITDPLSNVTNFVYDGVSRLSTATDAANNQVVLTYDDNGNVTQIKRRDWNQVTSGYDEIFFESTYDDLDRVVTTTRRDSGTTMSSTTSREYDGRGLLTKLTDELGNTQHHEWDGHARLLKTIRDLRTGGTGAGSVTATIEILRQYDLGGRLTQIKDGETNPTDYEYDVRSRVKKVTNAASDDTTRTFDENGNVLTVTDAMGTVVSNTYDVMNRLTAQSATPATGVLGDTSLDVEYDDLGRVTKIEDDDSTVEYAYDSLGRLTSETQGPNPIGTSGKTFGYGYDAAGRMTSIGYPDGTTENRNRDAVGRISSIAIAGGSTLASYQYAGFRIPALTLANSVVRTETFDALLRTTTVEYKQSTTSLKKFEYVFNLADQRQLEKRHHASGTGDNYTLDSIYRTVKVKAGVSDPVAEHSSPGSQTVTSTTDATYDKAQSRTQIVVTTGGTPATTNYTSDSLNFYTAVGGVTHARDANGNLRDDGTNLYDYDYRNQLVRIRLKSSGATIATYDYDGRGRRIAKTVSGSTTQFFWIGLQMAMEYDASGLFSRRHYGAEFGTVVSAHQRDIADLDQDTSTTDYVPLTPLYDGAFDCVGVLDHTGAVAESYVHTYDGAVTITNAAGGTISATAIGWHQGYGRMYRDSESNLLYTVFRHYDPALGRFINEDPPGRWFDQNSVGNGFAWLGGRYRNGWDPLGLREDVPPGEKSWDQMSQEEKDDAARNAQLSHALRMIENDGPKWARDLLERRRNIWGTPGARKRGFNQWGFKLKQDMKQLGYCTNYETGLNEIYIWRQLPSKNYARDYKHWIWLLGTIYHELIHDYDGFNIAILFNDHPEVSDLGVKGGERGYDDAAEKLAAETIAKAAPRANSPVDAAAK